MGQVSWSRQPGSLLEEAIAAFIASEYPQADHLKPSQGDGGIDILVRQPSRTVVYQVKGFHQTLSAAQKRQVEGSIDRLVSDPRWAGLNVDEWHLVAPVDPTPEALRWLIDYAVSRGLPEPRWDGLTQCDLWASKHPNVVDYFFEGSRQYVIETANLLTKSAQVSGIPPQELDSLAAVDLAEALQPTVQLLNQKDPLYRYEVSFRSGVTDPLAEFDKMEKQPPRPGLVDSTSIIRSGDMVIIDVFATSNLSTVLRPVTMKVTLTAKTIEERRLVEDWRKYGSPLELPHGAVSGEYFAPDGSVRPIKDAAVKMVPASTVGDDDGPTQIKVIVYNREEVEVAAIDMTRKYVTSGYSDDERAPEGLESRFEDATKTLSMTLRFDQSAQETSARFTITYPAGALAVDAARVTRVMLALQDQTNSFVITPRFGPISKNYLSLQRLSASRESGIRQWYLAAHALELLQSRTSTPLRMPADITTENYETMTRAVYSGALLDGQTMILKIPMLCVNDQARPVEADQLMHVLVPWPVILPETTIELGPVIYTFLGSPTDPPEGTEGHHEVGPTSDDHPVLWIKIKDERVEARLPRQDEIAQVSQAFNEAHREPDSPS